MDREKPSPCSHALFRRQSRDHRLRQIIRDKTITTEDEPYGIVSTMDGKKLYVTHEYPGKISEINTTDFKVTQVFNAGK